VCENWVTFWQLGTLELINKAIAFLFLILCTIEVFGDLRQLGLEFLELLQSDRLIVSFFIEHCQYIALRLLLLVYPVYLLDWPRHSDRFFRVSGRFTVGVGELRRTVLCEEFENLATGVLARPVGEGFLSKVDGA
jgi:hypothetical protein